MRMYPLGYILIFYTYITVNHIIQQFVIELILAGVLRKDGEYCHQKAAEKAKSRGCWA